MSVFYLAHPKTKSLVERLQLPVNDVHFGFFSEHKTAVDQFIANGGVEWVAIGGDGTVFDLMNGLYQTGSLSYFKFGAIAAGSSNDFHKSTIQIPPAGFSRTNFSQVQSTDLMLFKMDQHMFVSSLNASVGTTAEANSFFNSSNFILNLLKKINMNSAILFSALRTLFIFKPVSLKINDDLKSIANLGIAKSRFFAGGFCYPDQIQANDGKMGIFLVPYTSKLKMLQALIKLGQNRFFEIPQAQFSAQDHLQLQSENYFLIEINGEVFKTKNCEITLLPGALKLCPILKI